MLLTKCLIKKLNFMHFQSLIFERISLGCHKFYAYSFPKACTTMGNPNYMPSDTNVVRQPEMSRGGIPPLGPIWVRWY